MKKRAMTSLVATIGLVVGVQHAGALPLDDPTYQDIDVYRHLNVNNVSVLGVLLDAANPSQTGTFDIRSRDSDGSPAVTINAGGEGNAYLNAGTRYTDLLGFVAGGPEQIESAMAYFYLRGANGDNDVYSFDLTDFAIASTEGQGTFARMILGGDLGSLALELLNVNGFLEYTVQRDGGSFYLDYAQLQVVAVTSSGPETVPDSGSTAGLLGCAFVAIGAISRKLKHQEAQLSH